MLVPPAQFSAAVTVSDTVDFPLGAARGLYIGGAGVVQVLHRVTDTAAVAYTCTAGQVLPVAAKRVLATGTTATLINALY